MQQTEKDILLGKWLAGELSEEEAKRFQEDDAAAQEAKQIWDVAASYQPNADIGRQEQAWSSISKRTGPEQKPARQTSVVRLFTRIAASVALLVGLFFTYQHFDQKETFDRALTSFERVNVEQKLPDGSSVWLNEGASLRYSALFGTTIRRVQLEGEAFFDVQKDGTSFVIETPNSEVRVLGTSFNVETTEQQTKVSVTSGLVELKSNRSGKAVEINPNEEASYDVTSQRIQLSKMHDLNHLAWHTEKLYFENAPLSDVVLALSKYFKKDIQLESDALKGCPFTSPKTQLDLDETLNALAIAFDFEIEKKTDTVLLKNGRCK